MKYISIFNQVIGPVMRGPSSSHTAGAYFIGKIARSLLNDKVKRAVITFDPYGSYARTYQEQAADLSFACGLLGIELVDDRFFQVLEIASKTRVDINFRIEKLDRPEHPNTLEMDLTSEKGEKLRLRAVSVGGGSVEIKSLEDWEVYFTGTFHEMAVEVESASVQQIVEKLESRPGLLEKPKVQSQGNRVLVSVRSREPFPAELLREIRMITGVKKTWVIEPVCPVIKREPLFRSAAEMVELAAERQLTLGELALEYEVEALGISKDEVRQEAGRRFNIMRQAVHQGLELEGETIQLLRASAGNILRLENQRKLPGVMSGPYLRAAARAMAVMHINGKRGVVCAAPTGGSAGTLPGVLVTLLEDEGLRLEAVLRALMAAGAIGVIVDSRATFAAEVAGCQVEIGAAGAMAAAAVVDAYGGNVHQAADAAAIAFQNIMGSVCDLVQGKVEIPCHTRNALGAAQAFLCAGLIMGGYENPINLDETIDAVYATGKMLPPELRCTARGGLAVCPSALKLTSH
ncbi:MAG: L-serine ammonia-lyase, iron-sulfur-dependent, subunit alpha [Candidatus Saccharicenans sp.]|uniref:L-serine ammonia-lyase, iron-sulfur-dependent, subunit alpha n=1 Tax=Candidatus Saccharicenans sp. TaxID=2819258 RepID=UPI00404B4BFD